MEFTKDEVQETLNLSAGHALSTADAFRLHKLARQLLASIEQEPVYQACKEAGVWVDVEPDEVFALRENGEQVRALYAAPQLPQPAVPDEMYWQDAPVEGSTRAAAYATGWNACRAAMLQDAEPAQQWIPCSERLPPEGYEPDGGAVCYLVWHKDEVDCGPQYSISNVFFLRKHWEKNYTHWMPLPAAPQQEVKSGR